MKNTVKQIESPILRLDLASRCLEMQKEIEGLRSESSHLKAKILLLEETNHQMLKYEIQYRSIIKSYQIELKKRGGLSDTVFETSSDKLLSNFSDTHKELNQNISKLQSKITEILSDREQAIITMFDSKLNQLNKNLDLEKKEKFEHLEGLAEREQILNKELQMLKGSIEVIEAKNSYLEQENKRIKQLLKAKDTEISGLEKKMFELKEKSISFPNIKTSRSKESNTKSQQEIKTHSLAIETDEIEDESYRYQKIIQKLQKMLAIEKNNVRAARNAYFTELNNRSEIEEVVLNCIQEVSKEKKNAKRTSFQLSYNMTLVEKLTKNEELLRNLQEYLNQKKSGN
jgi:hypothetical protein